MEMGSLVALLVEKYNERPQIGRVKEVKRGRQTCPAKGKGSLTHREDPGKQQA